ncbi:MAG: hypothetical protein OZ918_09515 [Nitrospirales bacterium]|nr:hypothetical protein [Nitrospirales bacterium]
MRTGRDRQRRQGWVAMAVLGLLLLPGLSTAGPSDDVPTPQQQEQRIELLMRNYDFALSDPRPIRFGVPTVIILRNQDIVPHGFQSSALPTLRIRAQGEGLTAYGIGIEGFHVDPGKTLVLHFVPESNARLTFRCDLHPQMKGELFVLEIPSA